MKLKWSVKENMAALLYFHFHFIFLSSHSKQSLEAKFQTTLYVTLGKDLLWALGICMKWKEMLKSPWGFFSICNPGQLIVSATKKFCQTLM